MDFIHFNRSKKRPFAQANEQKKAKVIQNFVYIGTFISFGYLIFSVTFDLADTFLNQFDQFGVFFFLIFNLLTHFSVKKRRIKTAVYLMATGIAGSAIIANIGESFQIDFFIGASAAAIVLLAIFQSAKEASYFATAYFLIGISILQYTNQNIFSFILIRNISISGVIFLPIYFGIKYQEQIYLDQIKKLKDNELLFRQLFNYSPIPAAIFSIDKKFIDVNYAFQTLIHLDKSEIIGTDSYKFLSSEEQETADELLTELKHYGSFAIKTLTINLKNQTKATLYCKFSLLQRDSEPQIIMQAIDITTLETARIALAHVRHAAEILDFEKREQIQNNEIYRLRNIELLELNNQLKSLLQEKEDLLGIVAHDLKNPLTGLNLTADLLELQLQSEGTLASFNQVEKIKNLCDRMLYIVNQLLEVGELDAGRTSFTTGLIEIGPLLTQILAEHDVQARNKEIHLMLTRLPDPIYIEADPDKLTLVISNLISNAIKFSYPQQTVHVFVVKENNDIVIGVRDLGQGIPKDDFAQLFKRYSRLTARPTAGESSTGLGLYIVKKWVEVMGGQIEVFSKGLGSGAKFLIKFPLVNPPQKIESAQELVI